jgi:acetate kinase
LTGIGHRIVHGGSELAAVELVTTSNAQRIRDLLLETIPLAPLHNPPAIQCFDAVRAVVPDCPNVLVFDTGFFRDLPDAAARYALPAWCLDEYKIRRYGAHGTSHRFVARRATELLLEAGIPYGKLITCHLGNGASMTAIREGRPLDTSMGLTPLEGLIMGTRSGDIDPAIIPFLQRHAKLDADGIDRLLNRESGLKGLCGDNDMRAIERRASVGDTSAELALEMFCQRIRKYVGAYAAVLGGLDALVFTAGIGQHSSLVRKLVCERLAFLGLSLDLDANDDGKTFITKQDSQVTAMVVATDEELAIYHEARSMLVNRA